MQAVDELDHHKQHKGHDEEVDDRVDEFADLDAGTAQADHDIREICLEEQADQRVDDVIHQSRDDGRERTADDDTDCHIHDVSAFFHLLLLLIFCFFSGEPRFFKHFQFPDINTVGNASFSYRLLALFEIHPADCFYFRLL